MGMDIWGPEYCCDDEELIQSLKSSGCSDEEIEFIIRDDDTDEDRRDSTYKGSYRNVFYPSNFDAGVWDEIYERDIGKICPICKNMQLKPGQDLEVDHDETVVEHFNTKGYRMNQSQRREWYNTTDNLQLVHKACNRRKSGNGYHFAQEKVQIAIRNFQ